MTEKFQARYEVADGYAGKSRPLHVSIAADDLYEEMTDEDIREVYEENIRCHFEQNVRPEGDNEAEFLTWAKETIKQQD
jgi:hypothetical protein